jgi:uncharacterized OB-fold protein
MTVNVEYKKPLPRKDALNAPFWEHAKAHELAVQHCTACGHLHFPPTPVCPNCLSEAQDWQVVSGRGTVLYWIYIHRAYWPAYEAELPYNVCAIKLDEGPILLSNVVGVDAGGVQEGMKVEVTFEDVTADTSLPKFCPV